MKKALKIILILLLVLVLLVAAYVAYVFLTYYRIEDHQTLTVTSAAAVAAAEKDRPYKLVSWNIGFGAYEDDYGFFMDGGTQSWAWSPERLTANLDRIGALLAEQNADFLLVQEVDTSSTRTYHVDEYDLLREALAPYDSVFAQNYDSPFLMYPLTQPHGANKSGIGTFSKIAVTSAERRSLPIETGMTKLVDLDRCYSVSRIPVSGGGELVLYDLHLSAYTTDGTIATEQLKMLLADMQAEYEAGNWCVAGGDFNKSLVDDPSAFGVTEGEYTWGQAIPPETFDGVDIVKVPPFDEKNPVPSCRNADGPYHAGQYVVTVDGFFVSPNVAVSNADVLDTQFRYSDHNPVAMIFTLQ
ncbi:MAG: endonuclease/exonuclease/phosphatase family protein [Oscillospiraceae bacterium]|nr:endonuclease/exonuclease/phosphatase family protein [Oscillospiraceae bacterium]